MIKAPAHENNFTPYRIIITTTPMCATDEKAITDFRSVIFKQVIPTNDVPTSDTIENILQQELLLSIGANRMTPSPPSFNKIPAKIIEPYTGAST